MVRLSKQKLKDDFTYWINNDLCKIRYKNAKIDFWRLNPEQARYAEGCTNRDIIVKPRQCGWSTVIQWRGLKEAITHEGYQYLAIYHKLQAAQKAFANLKIMVNSIREELRPTIDKDNVSMLSFPILNSGMSVTSCGRTPESADEVGKSETINFLHCSEAAYYPYPKQTLGSVFNCVPKSEDGGITVIESTANGYNDFQQRAMAAYNGRSIFKLFFSPWFAYEEYEIKGIVWEDLGTLSEKEVSLVDKYKINAGQILWRRHKIDELRDERIFERDYPTDIFSCFLKMEGCIFVQDSIDRYVNLILQPLEGYKPEYYIYQPPIRDRKYIIVADVALGKRKGKFCSAQIIAEDNWEQVGHIFGKWPPDIYGDILVHFGEMYNEAEICVENDGIGQGTISRLKSLGYPNIYRHRTKGAFGDLQFEWGFPTTPKTRKELIDDIEIAVRKMEIIIHDSITLEQMRTFVLREDGTVGAAPGCFDDAVMSLGIAIQVLKQPKFVRRVWSLR